MNIELTLTDINTIRVALHEMVTKEDWKKGFTQPIQQHLEEVANSLFDKFNEQSTQYYKTLSK